MPIIPEDARLFVIDLEYLVPLSVIDSLYDAHKAFLQELYQQGRIIVSGPKDPRIGGVIVALGKDVADIEATFGADPFLTENAARATITAFHPRMVVEALR